MVLANTPRAWHTWGMTEQRTCQRFIGQQAPHFIQPGELYRVAGASYRRFCAKCASDVFGPEWATGKYADVCRDGYQVPHAERMAGE